VIELLKEGEKKVTREKKPAAVAPAPVTAGEPAETT
jgi:hypothetical protein